MAKNNDWDFKWKINSNEDPSQQTQNSPSVKSRRKYLLLFFNNIQLTQSSSQKQNGVIPEYKLKFRDHLKMMTSKINKLA